MEDANYKTLLGMVIKDITSQTNTNPALHHQRILTLGPTPQVLTDLGMPQLPIVILGRVIDKAIFDHGITKGLLERLYTLIATPKAVYQAHQGQPGSVVVTYEVKNTAPIIVAIHPDKQMGGRGQSAARYNNVASVYDKQSGKPNETIEVRWKREGLLLWEATAVQEEKQSAEVIPLRVAGMK
jgi:Phage MuF-C-terminal domain